MATAKLDKGFRAEELLRAYFISAGFFAVRGVPLTYEGFDITDLDLWLYIRSSSVGRERANVDAKNRSTPKALERVLWAKGLQATLGLERCIVATTDKRAAVKEYGTQHGVMVLDGSFLDRLAHRVNGSNVRLVEEELAELIGPASDDKLHGNWRSRMTQARGRLVTTLEFDGCNAWLDDVRFFLEQRATSARHEAACRLTYLVTSYFLIGLDFSLRTLALEDVDVRRSALDEGFRYGSRGRAGIDDALQTASGLIEAYQPELRSAGNSLRNRVREELAKLPSDGLADFFARTEVVRDLFSTARSLESAAYSRSFITPGSLDSSSQSVLGVLLDFHGIDRRAFLR